jgi:hypothetical protein
MSERDEDEEYSESEYSDDKAGSEKGNALDLPNKLNESTNTKSSGRTGEDGGSEYEATPSESSEKSQEFMEVLGNSGLAESVFGNLARAARLGKGIDEDVGETSDFALKTMEKLAFHYKQFSSGPDDVLFDSKYIESRREKKKAKQISSGAMRQGRRGAVLMQGDIRDGHNQKNKVMMQQLLALQSAEDGDDGDTRERFAFRSGTDDFEPIPDPVPAHEVHINKTGRAYVHQSDRWRKPPHVII